MTMRKYDLPEGHFYGVPMATSISHSGDQVEDDSAVRAIQKAVSAKQTGTFDKVTKKAVARFQAKNKLPVSGIVDSATWKALKIEK